MNNKTHRRPVKWSSFAQTDKGMIREVNEDAIISREDIGLWAVADGMGGHAIGDVASTMVIDSLAEAASKSYLNDSVVAVEDCLLQANSNIYAYSQRMLDGATMGTTVIALLLHDQVGVCFWVGDSRLYRHRDNELLQLTRDHSQVEEWLQQGLLQPEEAGNHPQRNVITRAVGVEDQLNIDMDVFDASIGDTFLLCSDGLYNAIDRKQIVDGLSCREAKEAVTTLMTAALANGASDNVSIIVVKGEPGESIDSRL